MDPKQCWVTCTVSLGLFDNEYEAQFTTLGPKGNQITSSSVVSGDTLMMDEKPTSERFVSAKMRVWCLEQLDDFVLVVLPQATNDSRVKVKVPESAIAKDT